MTGPWSIAVGGGGGGIVVPAVLDDAGEPVGVAARSSVSPEHPVDRAMAATSVSGLRDRRLDTLSGGQRQRVWLAVVLAQDTPIVCLDEPINHLDLAHQLECLELVRSLNRDFGKTIIVVLHDLNLAARYADHLVVLKSGHVHAQGDPRRLVTEALVRDVFGVESRIIADPVHGSPLCIPIAPSSAPAMANA